MRNTVPLCTVREAFIDVGVELAAGILVTFRLTELRRIHQLESNVGATEIHTFIALLDPRW